MGSLRRSRAWPTRWPVRWRLATVSAGLTFFILLVFGIVVGQLASQRLREDFNDELHAQAESLANKINLAPTSIGGVFQYENREYVILANNDESHAQLIGINGVPVTLPPRDVNLGDPIPGVHDVDDLRVVTETVRQDGQPIGYVQYGRSRAKTDDAVERLWVSIIGGIAGATLLAFLAGVAISARAMRPISSLTATAREIAATRDPSLKIPDTGTQDEIAELADTLRTMLHSLDEAQAERERSMQRQKEFVADASHELRTPLTSVLANLELLQESLGATGDADDRDSVASALRSSRRMRRLVGDLQLLARADAGRLSPHRDCDLAEIVRDSVAEMRPIADGHDLVADIPASLPIHGDPDELHRVANNLIENAVRHTPPGTEIEVDVYRENGSALLAVSDSGPGVPRGLRQQIFDRFVRKDGPGDTAAGQGSGLGLAIVKAVTEVHEGDVRVEESEQGGARFVVRLPAGAENPKETVSGPLEPI